MDSAAAKRLDSADTHWPRESSKKTMTTQHMSSDLELLRHWSLQFNLKTNNEEKSNIQERNMQM